MSEHPVPLIGPPQLAWETLWTDQSLQIYTGIVPSLPGCQVLSWHSLFHWTSVTKTDDYGNANYNHIKESEKKLSRNSNDSDKSGLIFRADARE